MTKRQSGFRITENREKSKFWTDQAFIRVQIMKVRNIDN
ncbi:hypothetical protein BVRB_5g102210 [Beta vulgaris subsp. vulgaris]|nr:hypothetical protein BVRB_5g102210 [Beta vulgaris subsp. vulgaris]